MKLHRFYVGDTELEHSFWFSDKDFFHQWTKVLRFQEGRELVLFNGQKEVRLYKIVRIGNDAVQLELVTELETKLPTNDIYLCFSLLKKDKNDWILQKATELGVNHFLPLISERTEKTGFNVERALKIVTEASEQCGRSEIPRVREPITPGSLINEFEDKIDICIAEQGKVRLSDIKNRKYKSQAVLIGPEGGWSDDEKKLFEDNNLQHLALSEFTLRAETAAITAAALLQ